MEAPPWDKLTRKSFDGAARLRLLGERLASIIMSSYRTPGERGKPDAVASNARKSTHA